MVTNNSINVTAAGLITYDGAGNFTSSPLVNTNVLIGNSSANGTSNVAPPTNIGTPLVSNGATGSAPIFGTALVRGGGTGLTTLATNQLLAGGTTGIGNVQQIGSGTAGQVLVSAGSSSLPSFQSSSIISSWIVQGSSTTAAASTGYFVNNNTASITLPTGSATGTTISIYNDVGLSVVVNAGVAQTIRIAALTSSSGGTATSSAQGDCLTLVFRSDTSTWNTVSSEGTWVLA
jgi:hypothetical protein